MRDCLFCKIVRGEISADKVYEDEAFLAFRDIQPEAPVHVVVIPKKHIPTLNDITETDAPALGGLFTALHRVAKAENVAETGYRTVINCNKDAGQLIMHIHAHLLGGREMGWPPG